jgi:glycosyltransferase involved in cell wall biosynthesis
MIAGLKQMESERIRLLKFIPLFGIGGTEKQVANIAMRLDRSLFDLSFGCVNKWGDLLESIEQADIKVAEYPIRSFYEYNTFKQQYSFSKALKTSRIQIMHSYNFYANVFSIPAAKYAGVPCIVASIRDMGVYLSPMQLQVQKWVCRMADRIVVNADAIRTWLVNQGYKPDNITVIRNGLDTTRYPGKSDGRKLRLELRLPPRAPLVVMVSRLNPQKGVEYFIKAAARVRQSCPEAYFLVVGGEYIRTGDTHKPGNEYRKTLQELASYLGISDHVRFTGMRSDIPEILSSASVSVLPSFSEGISNTVLESMAAGAPVVATNVGGMHELIESGRHGLLIPPKDMPALADAICAILKNTSLAARFSEQARKRIDTEFSIDRMIEEMQTLYVDLLKQKYMVRRITK